MSFVLAAPLQAWGGHQARFARRTTQDAPTKSAVIGLLAAASGKRRTDPLEWALDLRLGVRVDQVGQLERDFQTARNAAGVAMPLQHRYYRADARYLVAISGNDELLDGLAQALLAPTFPLYLGRRSCPPADPILPVLHENTSIERLLLEHPWQAHPRWKATHPDPSCAFHIDAHGATGELDEFVLARADERDVPESFDPAHRKHGWRTVLHGFINAPVPAPALTGAVLDHDPMVV